MSTAQKPTQHKHTRSTYDICLPHFWHVQTVGISPVDALRNAISSADPNIRPALRTRKRSEFIISRIGPA